MARPDAPAPGPPGRHHDPPAEIGSFTLPLRITKAPWFRSHGAELEAIYFGRSRHHRFDAPGGEFGTLYLAQDPHCAFIETFGHRTGEVEFVTLDALGARCLARIQPERSLRLVDLSGAGLARLRADARLATGSIAVSQRWALALHQHPDRPDGICYRSRHDPDRVCAAIFERVGPCLASTSVGSLAEPGNATLLAEILDAYDFGLIT